MPTPINPVAWGANEHRRHSTYRHDVDGLADNEQNLKPGTLLTYGTAGSYKQAVPGDEIVGVNKSDLITTATNRTVEQKKLLFTRIIKDDSYVFTVPDPVSGPFLTKADINKYYDIDAEHHVDPTTWSATRPTDITALVIQLVSVFEGGKSGEFIFTHA